MFKLFGLFGLFIAITLSACATTHRDTLSAYPGESAQQIFAAGKNNLQRGNFNEASKRFIALAIQHPVAAENEIAAIYLLYSYYRQEEFTNAIATATSFIRVYPAGASLIG